MKKWFQNLGDKMRSFMYGRYGCDELSRALSVTALICLLVAMFTGWQLLSAAALVLWVWALIRGCSKNVSGRKRENDSYLRFRDEIVYQISLRKKTREIRKSYRYFTCKDCKCRYRVPKGQGKIQITCPNCGKKTIRRT